MTNRDMMERAERLMEKTSSYTTWCARNLDQKEYFSDSELDYAFVVNNFATNAYLYLRKEAEEE